MAVSYLVSPVTWVADSSGVPSLTISSIPAGSNRKLVMSLKCRDSDTWNITTLTIGGQTYTSITSPAVVDSTQSITAIWDETAIAAMSGTALTYADDTFQSPQGASYYVVEDVDQAAAVVTDSGLTGQNTAEATVTTSGNTANDLVVVTGAISDNLPSFDDYDSGSLTEDQQQTLTNLTCMTANHQGTDTSFTVGTTGSTNDVILQAVVHKAAAAASVTVTNVDDITLESDQESVTITGTGFNASQGDGRVLIAPTDDVADASAVAQQIVSWSDTSIVFNVSRGSLAHTSTMYLFVENSDDESNSAGYNVSFVDETPSFTSAPTVTTTTSSRWELTFTTDYDCTVHAVAVLQNDTAPSVAQVKAGQNAAGSAALAAANTLGATDGGVADTLNLSSTEGLDNPIYDLYVVATNTDGDSARVDLVDEALDAPTGKQDVTAAVVEISAATQANPVRVTATAHGLVTGDQIRIWGVVGMTELNSGEDKDPVADDGLLYYEVTRIDDDTIDLDDIDGTAFTAYSSGGYLSPGYSIYEDASPAVVDGDVIRIDTVTSPGGYAITLAANGIVSYAGAGDTARQAIVADHYDASLQAMAGEVTIYNQNDAPSLSADPIPPQIWEIDVAIPTLNLDAYISDPESDAVTYSVSDDLPAGVTHSGSTISGTPTEAGGADVTVTATDALGDSRQIPFTYIVESDEDPVSGTPGDAPASQTMSVTYEAATMSVVYSSATMTVDP